MCQEGAATGAHKDLAALAMYIASAFDSIQSKSPVALPVDAFVRRVDVLARNFEVRGFMVRANELALKIAEAQYIPSSVVTTALLRRDDKLSLSKLGVESTECT